MDGFVVHRATEERESEGRKRRKYDNDYLKCSWIGSEDAPKPQCVIYKVVLANDSMKPW